MWFPISVFVFCEWTLSKRRSFYHFKGQFLKNPPKTAFNVWLALDASWLSIVTTYADVCNVSWRMLTVKCYSELTHVGRWIWARHRQHGLCSSRWETLIHFCDISTSRMCFIVPLSHVPARELQEVCRTWPFSWDGLAQGSCMAQKGIGWPGYTGILSWSCSET